MIDLASLWETVALVAAALALATLPRRIGVRFAVVQALAATLVLAASTRGDDPLAWSLRAGAVASAFAFVPVRAIARARGPALALLLAPVPALLVAWRDAPVAPARWALVVATVLVLMAVLARLDAVPRANARLARAAQDALDAWPGAVARFAAGGGRVAARVETDDLNWLSVGLALGLALASAWLALGGLA